MFLINSKRTKVFPFIQRNNKQSVLGLHLLFRILIIVYAAKLIPAMLAPPLTTSRTLATTMQIQMTRKMNNQQQRQQWQQQQKQPPHENLPEQTLQPQRDFASAFSNESMDFPNDASPPQANATATSPINSSASSSLPAKNVKRFKTFPSETLVNANNANANDSSVSQYTPASSQLSSSALDASPSVLLQGELYDDIVVGAISEGVAEGGFIGNITDGFGSYATATADVAVMTLSNTTAHLETTTAVAAGAFPSATQTVATFIAGNKNRATTIIIYPTVSPESIVIPIVSCIFGFPILAFIVICCLRHRAKLARERDRRRNYDMQDHAVSLVRFSPIHRLNYRSSRAISLRPERSLSQGFTSLELDTVVEERCSDVEQTQTEILHPESPMESSTSYKMSVSSS